jgi:hypothetical protein
MVDSEMQRGGLGLGNADDKPERPRLSGPDAAGEAKPVGGIVREKAVRDHLAAVAARSGRERRGAVAPGLQADAFRSARTLDSSDVRTTADRPGRTPSAPEAQRTPLPRDSRPPGDHGNLSSAGRWQVPRLLAVGGPVTLVVGARCPGPSARRQDDEGHGTAERAPAQAPFPSRRP